MRKMTAIFAGVGAVFAGAAMAQPVNEQVAREALYNPKRVEVVVTNEGGLSAEDKRIIAKVAQQVAYYAAVAVSPDEGIMSTATIAAADHHSTSAAAVAARAACDAKRTGAAPCVIVAYVRPRGWEADRPVQLGSSATRAFEKEYRRGSAPKAMAFSPKSGRWGIARGEGAEAAALRTCNARASEAGVTDCNIMVKD